MQILLKILAFCNVLEYDQARLSLTNLALIALVAKMVFTSNLDWPSVVSVITVFSNYAHKRIVSSQAPKDSTADAQS